MSYVRTSSSHFNGKHVAIINKRDIRTVPANGEVKTYQLSDEELESYRNMKPDEYKSKPLNFRKEGYISEKEKENKKIEHKERRTIIKILQKENEDLKKQLDKANRQIELERTLNKELIHRLQGVTQ